MTPTEKKVCAVVAEVLGLEQVMPSDDIIELGGDSHHMVQIALALEDDFGAELSIDFADYDGLIANIAATIEQQLSEARASR